MSRELKGGWECRIVCERDFTKEEWNRDESGRSGGRRTTEGETHDTCDGRSERFEPNSDTADHSPFPLPILRAFLAVHSSLSLSPSLSHSVYVVR